VPLVVYFASLGLQVTLRCLLAEPLYGGKGDDPMYLEQGRRSVLDREARLHFLAPVVLG
jgi:hypothetical protein